MPVKEVVGDLFSLEPIDALAHGCNCAGAMGAGIAVEFKRRWPEMYFAYRERCLARQFRPGDVFTWQGVPTVFNLGTQATWRTGATLEAVRTALANMADEARNLGIKSIAMPRIAAGLGGLPWANVLGILEETAGADFMITVAVLARPSIASPKRRRHS